MTKYKAMNRHRSPVNYFFFHITFFAFSTHKKVSLNLGRRYEHLVTEWARVSGTTQVGWEGRRVHVDAVGSTSAASFCTTF